MRTTRLASFSPVGGGAVALAVAAASLRVGSAACAAEVLVYGPRCVAPGSVLEVGLVVDPKGASVVGLQALLQYDASALRLLSFEEGDSPYVVSIWSSVDTVAATIDVAVGFDPALGYGQSPIAVAKRLRFEVISSSECDTAGLLSFREDPPFKTLLTGVGGAAIDPDLLPLGPLTVSEPPALAQPADVLLAPTPKMDCVVPEIATPQATSSCGPAPSVSFTRSDGATDLSAPFCRINSPVIITWTAADDCGRSVSVSQVVTVPGMPGDFNSDGAVDAYDLAVVLSAWGLSSGDGDINGDLTVDGTDLSMLLGRWTDFVP
jgi:hypothetical protein